MQARPHTAVDCDRKVTQDAKVHTTLLRLETDGHSHQQTILHANVLRTCAWEFSEVSEPWLQGRPADEASVLVAGSRNMGITQTSIHFTTCQLD